MALRTICRILRAEGLRAVVAGTAELTIVDVFHGDSISALLHFEDARLMAVRALVALVSMGLAVKYNLAGALAVKLHRLACRNRERGHGHGERYHYYESQYGNLFHSSFTSFHHGILNASLKQT